VNVGAVFVDGHDLDDARAQRAVGRVDRADVHPDLDEAVAEVRARDVAGAVDFDRVGRGAGIAG
jgi:hypothetical protein